MKKALTKLFAILFAVLVVVAILYGIQVLYTTEFRDPRYDMVLGWVIVVVLFVEGARLLKWIYTSILKLFNRS